MTKYEGDQTDDHTVGLVAGALANPRRRAVITRLCAGAASTSELADHAGTALPTMQQHLEALRTAGLVTSSKHGRTVTHTVVLDPLLVLEDWVATRRLFWSSQLDVLATALESDR
jgi:DNA-binding transcriptional ArsR family regulator